jgi:methyl-accepting chemotaxis protein
METNRPYRSDIFGVIGLVSLVVAALAVLGAAPFLAQRIGASATVAVALALACIAAFVALELTAIRRLRRYGGNIDLTTANTVDLRLRLPVSPKNELDRFSRSFNILLAKIHNVIFQMKNIASRGVQTGAELAESAQKIAAAVEEPARTIASQNDSIGRSPR